MTPTPSDVLAPVDLSGLEGFTPGPWSVRMPRGVGWPGPFVDGPDGEIVLVGPPEGDGHELIANARLIAAAPALLSELKSLRAANEAYRKTMEHIASAPRTALEAELIALRARCGELEEALTDISDARASSVPDRFGESVLPYEHARDIARQALRLNPKGK